MYSLGMVSGRLPDNPSPSRQDEKRGERKDRRRQPGKSVRGESRSWEQLVWEDPAGKYTFTHNLVNDDGSNTITVGGESLYRHIPYLWLLGKNDSSHRLLLGVPKRGNHVRCNLWLRT